MEVKQLKVYQSVKIGSKELTFISGTEYKIVFKPDYQCVVVDDTTVIPCNNIPWLQLKEAVQKAQPIVRTAKKTIEVG